MNDTNVKAYLELMVDVAVMFGANRTRAEKEMTDVLKFEIELAKVKFVCKMKCQKKKPILIRFIAASIGI